MAIGKVPVSPVTTPEKTEAQDRHTVSHHTIILQGYVGTHDVTGAREWFEKLHKNFPTKYTDICTSIAWSTEAGTTSLGAWMKEHVLSSLDARVSEPITQAIADSATRASLDARVSEPITQAIADAATRPSARSPISAPEKRVVPNSNMTAEEHYKQHPGDIWNDEHTPPSSPLSTARTFDLGGDSAKQPEAASGFIAKLRAFMTGISHYVASLISFAGMWYMPKTASPSVGRTLGATPPHTASKETQGLSFMQTIRTERASTTGTERSR